MKKINTTIAILVATVILFYVGVRLAQPVFKYTISLDRYNLQRVTKDSVQNRDFLIINPDFDFFYKSLKVKTTKPKKHSELKNRQLKIFKGYLAQFYPLGKEITTEEELENHLFGDLEIASGTLFIYQNSVYIADNGKKRSFLNPRVFERLGLDWDNLRKVDKAIAAKMPKGEMVWFSSHHVDGTILECDNGDLFLVSQKQLLSIKSKEILAQVWPDFYTVKISSLEPTFLGQMEFSNSLKAKFEIPENQKVNDIQGFYVFEVFDKDLFGQIEDAEIRLDTLGRFKEETIRTSLKVIKDELYEKYWPKVIK